MSADRIILWIMAIGALLGALDKITGNHFGLGDRFDDGFKALGPLALGMAGILCLTPVIANVLGPVVSPLFRSIGADPAMFASILANDMGGYSLATELAENPQAGLFSGNIIAAMLGCTLVFNIPVGLSLIQREDQPYFAKGLLVGLVCIPAGGFLGGLAAGFPVGMILRNLVPVISFAGLLVVGLLTVPKAMIKGCIVFGKGITVIIYIALAAAAFESMTGAVLIKGMTPIAETMESVSAIGVVLLGTFPMLTILTRVLGKPLNAIGERLGLDTTSTAGILFALANPVPVFSMMKDMKKRSIVVNTAWLMPATAALGDHLGFTAGVQPEMIAPMIIGKVTAGLLAAAIALAITRKTA